jgi:hypothetical protein
MSFGCYHRLCRAIRQSYKFISLIYKTPIVGALGRGSRTLLIVEKEVMAPRTVGGLTRGMAHDGHICHENYEFISAGGPAPEFAFRRALDLHFGDLDPVVYGGHTLRTALGGSIPEFTYTGGPVPSFAIGHGQVFHPRSQRPMAQGGLT